MALVQKFGSGFFCRFFGGCGGFFCGIFYGFFGGGRCLGFGTVDGFRYLVVDGLANGILGVENFRFRSGLLKGVTIRMVGV